MNDVIEILRKELEYHKKCFIENSIIVRLSKRDQPIPDTSYNLDMIININKAIDTLNERV